MVKLNHYSVVWMLLYKDQMRILPHTTQFLIYFKTTTQSKQPDNSPKFIYMCMCVQSLKKKTDNNSILSEVKIIMYLSD